MARALWLLDGFLWAAWVLVMSKVFPAFGKVFVEQAHSLNIYTSAFVALGGILGWKLLTPLLLSDGLFLCWKLATRTDQAKETKLPALVLGCVVGLWALTVVALVLPIFIG